MKQMFFLGIVTLTIMYIIAFLIIGNNPIKLITLLIYVLFLMIGTLTHYLIRWYYDITINEDNIYLKRKNIYAKAITEVIFIKHLYSGRSMKYVAVALIKYRNPKQKIKGLRFIPEFYCDKYKVSTEIIYFLNRNSINYSGEIIFYNE